MMAELFRIISHLVWYGTFALDLGAMSPVFYTFNDRERAFRIVEAICGGRMHPAWFRIGGVAQDLPQGWERIIKEFLDDLPERLDEYDRMIMGNRILQARTKGVGACTSRRRSIGASRAPISGPAASSGISGRSVPTRATSSSSSTSRRPEGGDCCGRAVVRVEEMRQSLRIIGQCLENMPGGPYKSDHPLATPPRKERPCTTSRPSSTTS